MDIVSTEFSMSLIDAVARFSGDQDILTRQALKDALENPDALIDHQDMLMWARGLATDDHNILM